MKLLLNKGGGVEKWADDKVLASEQALQDTKANIKALKQVTRVELLFWVRWKVVLGIFPNNSRNILKMTGTCGFYGVLAAIT